MFNRILMSLALIFAFALIACGQSATPQTPQKPTAFLNQLPPDIKEKAATLLNQEEGELRRVRLVGEIAAKNTDATRDFLISVYDSEKSVRIRRAIVDSLGRINHPKIREFLERAILNDADATVSRVALERLRVQKNIEMREMLMRRLETARAQNDAEGLKLLAEEQERWIALVRGAMLPSFLRRPPEVFSVKAENQPVRVLAFGDFGTGSKAQKETAAAMLAFHRKTPFDFGVTLGDNFYDAGMASPADARWKIWWEELYTPLGIKFYASLGNHDWGLADSPAAEILYSSASWKMPALYYTFTAGAAQFFALDTNEMSEAQLAWLKDQLDKSKARWKIVYGHHPIYSDGEHGDSLVLAQKLLPVIEGRADIYLVGHDHIIEHLKPSDSKIHYLIAGGGGATLYKLKESKRAYFAESVNGFAVLEATAEEIKVRFIGVDGKQLYEYPIRK
ncbi:MAG: metallophosphoesterase [Acidobacteriota bacterium]